VGKCLLRVSLKAFCCNSVWKLCTMWSILTNKPQFMSCLKHSDTFLNIRQHVFPTSAAVRLALHFCRNYSINTDSFFIIFCCFHTFPAQLFSGTHSTASCTWSWHSSINFFCKFVRGTSYVSNSHLLYNVQVQFSHPYTRHILIMLPYTLP
jgi:hypothetical protein